jgi:hypothetical protein
MEGKMQVIDALVEKLALNEDKVMELYSVFGDKFPAHAKFWKEISAEEKRHASLLREFGRMAYLTNLNLSLNHIKTETVDKSISFIDSEIEKAKNGKIDNKQAFELAKMLEQGLLESGRFNAAGGDAKHLEKLFSVLNADTSRHYEMMSKKLAGAGCGRTNPKSRII